MVFSDVFPPSPFVASLLKGFYFIQGFHDSSLSVWEASCVLRNFELRTGQTVSREDLDNGTLEGQFIDEDYALKDSVSFFPYLWATPSLYFVFNSLKSLNANFPLFRLSSTS